MMPSRGMGDINPKKVPKRGAKEGELDKQFPPAPRDKSDKK